MILPESMPLLPAHWVDAAPSLFTGAPSGARHHSETAGFMEVATKQVYGTASGGGSMAERVGRRKFFNDRTGSDNAFRR